MSATITATRGTRSRRARFAGALRLSAFVAVLAIIVGTSVGLASADQPTGDDRAATGKDSRSGGASAVLGPPAPEFAVGDDDGAAGDDAAAVASTERIPLLERDTADTGPPKAETRPVVETKPAAKTTERASGPDPEPIAPASDATPAVTSPAVSSAPGPTGSLPITGDLDSMRIGLGGAVLMLLGMLSQIAGQPLPARAAARGRR